MLIYVAAAITVWIVLNVVFVIWIGGGVRRSSNPSVGAAWVPEHLNSGSAPPGGGPVDTVIARGFGPKRSSQESSGVPASSFGELVS